MAFEAVAFPVLAKKVHRFFGHEIYSGTKAEFKVRAGSTITGSAFEIPVQVVRGTQTGPVVFLSAVVHGDEIAGVKILENVYESLNPDTLRGTVVMLPVMNPWGLQNMSRYMPDRRDLNRSFPGNNKGSMSARLAHFLFDNVIKNCDYGIDFHTGSSHILNAPQLRGDTRIPLIKEVLESAVDFIKLHSKPSQGTLRKAAAVRKIPVFLYEGGEAFRFTDSAVNGGEKAAQHVFRCLKMMGPRPGARRKRSPIYESIGWVRASGSGIFESFRKPGDPIRKGELIGALREVANSGSAVMIPAKQDGIVLGVRQFPFVLGGEPLVHLAKEKLFQAYG